MSELGMLGRHVVVVGPMGSGKTTVGGALAKEIGRPFLDSDEELARRLGRSSERFLESEGREVLHTVERQILVDLIGGETPIVFAAAASVVDDDRCLEILRNRAVTVVLDAERASLLDRIGDGVGRPIEGPIAETLDALEGPRAVRYAAVADLRYASEDDPAAAVRAIVDHLRRTVSVPLAERSYPVLIGPGARLAVDGLVPAHARRAVVVTQERIGINLNLALPHEVFLLPDGEKAKSLSSIETLASGFSRFGLTRQDVVIALGGGVVTDTAGFAAATHHRGTPLLNVSTTLLGQIDAAVGGKTGVNLPEGKNLVGAFWQPCAVVCDTDLLETMPERERRSGLGEMAKYAFLGVEDLDDLSIVDQVAACLEAKAAVVAADERESDLRMTLNYGHTLAHALEAAGFADGLGRDGVDLRHGEAVAIGLVFAARLAHLLGRIDTTRVARHIGLVESYGLPTEIPAAVDFEETIAAMARDKKATEGVTFVLDGAAGVEVVRDVEVETIREAFVATKAGGNP